MLYYVYTLSEPDTGSIRYVGISKQPFVRLVQHCKKCTYSKPNSVGKFSRIKNWVKSLLSKDLKPEMKIIAITDSRNKLYDLERYYISYYRDKGCDLVNCTVGGEGVIGYTFSEEEKEFISQRTTEAMWRPEIREPMLERAAKTRGKPSPFKGKTHSDESKLLISNNQKGRHGPQKGKPGKKWTEEQKRNQSESRSGKNNSFYTCPGAAEKIMNNVAKAWEKIKVKVVDKEGTIFSSVRDASKFYKINYNTLYGWLRKNKENIHGLRFYAKQL